MIRELVVAWLLGKGEMHLPSGVLVEAMKKENAKTKELEIKYNDKMSQHGVSQPCAWWSVYRRSYQGPGFRKIL